MPARQRPALASGAQAALDRMSWSTTVSSAAAARPTGPPAAPSGSSAQASCSWPRAARARPATCRLSRRRRRWMHSRSVPSAAASAERISGRLEDGSAGREPVGEPVQPAELAARRGVDLLPGDQRDDLVGVRLRPVDVGDEPAVAQHDDAVGEPEHLVDVVRDQQDRGALLAHARPSAARPAPTRSTPSDGGRLVEDQQPRPVAPSPAPPRAAGAGRPTAS